MGKKSSKAPKPPDPKAVASAQTSSNIGTALAEGIMNRVNQVTPDGSLTYAQSGATAWTDPLTGKVYQIPNYTATTALSPEQQKTKAEAGAAEFNLSRAANAMSGAINAGPFKVDDAVEARLFDLGRKRLTPRLDEARRKAETDAANRGLRLGSAAYDRLMRGVSEAENDAFNQLALTGRDQAYREARDEYDLPLNRIIALLSGSQVSRPNFVSTPQSGVANTDYANGVWNKFNADMAAYQQKQQEQQSMLGGLFTAAALPFAYSDERLKSDIKKVSETPDQIGIYRYRYKGDGPLRLGLIAQDVQKRKPEAVTEDAAGYKMVNYRKALRLGEHARSV
jgi:Chaperone of endosialidase